MKIDPEAQSSFTDTDELSVSYEVCGPETGQPVLLLHGWPDDLRTWDAVAPALAEAGCRVIVPSLRGFGLTRFLKSHAPPYTAEPGAMAHDAVKLLDALGIERAVVVGHDWGGRIGYAMAALWPERVERLVVMSVAYETNVKPGDKLNYQQGHAYWYQWFFGSERAREALHGNRRELCRYLWKTWAPTWNFTEEEFQRTAASWDNPAWVDVTLHSYRVRWGNAPADLRYAKWETRLKTHPTITVPTVLLHGELDGASLAMSSEGQEDSFSAGYRREVLPGAGHFLPRERPVAVITAVLDHHP